MKTTCQDTVVAAVAATGHATIGVWVTLPLEVVEVRFVLAIHDTGTEPGHTAVYVVRVGGREH